MTSFILETLFYVTLIIGAAYIIVYNLDILKNLKDYEQDYNDKINKRGNKVTL